MAEATIEAEDKAWDQTEEQVGNKEEAEYQEDQIK